VKRDAVEGAVQELGAQASSKIADLDAKLLKKGAVRRSHP
jgi:hypothetical protein